MPKSRNRKNHKKKVVSRNQSIKERNNKIRKEYTKMFENQMEVMKSKFSGTTNDDLNINIDNNKIPFDIITPEQ
jgi:hypothetical protein